MNIMFRVIFYEKPNVKQRNGMHTNTHTHIIDAEYSLFDHYINIQYGCVIKKKLYKRSRLGGWVINLFYYALGAY